MKKRLIFITKILISIFLMVILLNQMNFEDLVDLLLSVKVKIYVVTFFIVITGIFLSSYKWRLLLLSQKVKVNFKKLTRLYFIGFFFNNFLPTNVGGDAFRGYYLSKNSVIKLSVSLASITIERILGVITLIFLVVIGIFLNWELAERLNVIYILCLFILTFSLLLIILFNKKLKRIINSKFNFKISEKLSSEFKNLYNAINIYRKEKKATIQGLIISFVFQGMVIVNAYLYILAINNYISISQLVLIVPLISLISLIPISINGIGITEGAFVYFFTQTGMSSAEALAIALLSRGLKLGVSMIGGIIYILSNKDL